MPGLKQAQAFWWIQSQSWSSLVAKYLDEEKKNLELLILEKVIFSWKSKTNVKINYLVVAFDLKLKSKVVYLTRHTTLLAVTIDIYDNQNEPRCFEFS